MYICSAICCSNDRAFYLNQMPWCKMVATIGLKLIMCGLAARCKHMRMLKYLHMHIMHILHKLDNPVVYV